MHPTTHLEGLCLSWVGIVKSWNTYDARACFYLYEEALRAGACSERDIKYCFELAEEKDMQGVRLKEVTVTSLSPSCPTPASSANSNQYLAPCTPRLSKPPRTL